MRSLLDPALRSQQPSAAPEEITLGGDGADDPWTLTLTRYPEIAEGTQEVTGAVILAVDEGVQIALCYEDPDKNRVDRCCVAAQLRLSTPVRAVHDGIRR